jgi:hypothetical protein
MDSDNGFRQCIYRFVFYCIYYLPWQNGKIVFSMGSKYRLKVNWEQSSYYVFFYVQLNNVCTFRV